MNVLRLILTLGHIIVFIKHGYKMCFLNIIKINTHNNVGEIIEPSQCVNIDIEVQKGQLYTYSQHELHAVRETFQKDRKWKHIDYDTCKRVHSLRLNRRDVELEKIRGMQDQG